MKFHRDDREECKVTPEGRDGATRIRQACTRIADDYLHIAHDGHGCAYFGKATPWARWRRAWAWSQVLGSMLSWKLAPPFGWPSKWRWQPVAFPRSPTWPICWPAVTVSPACMSTRRMCAYQVVSRPRPVLT